MHDFSVFHCRWTETSLSILSARRTKKFFSFTLCCQQSVWKFLGEAHWFWKQVIGSYYHDQLAFKAKKDTKNWKKCKNIYLLIKYSTVCRVCRTHWRSSGAQKPVLNAFLTKTEAQRVLTVFSPSLFGSSPLDCQMSRNLSLALCHLTDVRFGGKNGAIHSLRYFVGHLSHLRNIVFETY